MTPPIYLHPELSIPEIRELALAHGLCLVEDCHGNYLLQPNATRLPNGARYINSAKTDIRATFARVKARIAAPPDR